MNAEFAGLWARHEVAEPRLRARLLDVPPFGRLAFAVSELHVAASPGLRIVVSTPEDDRTWSVVHDLTNERIVAKRGRTSE